MREIDSFVQFLMHCRYLDSFQRVCVTGHVPFSYISYN